MRLWAGGACVVFATRVLAQTTPDAGWAVTVAGSGPCPDPARVEDLLRTLLPRSASPRPVSAAVADQGESYEVDVEGRAKIYPDPARNCRERARVSAAFIALALAPDTAVPSAEPAPPPPPPPPASIMPPPPPPPAPEPAPFTPPWGRFDLRGAVEDAPELGLAAGGATLRASLGWQGVGAHVLCGWLVSDASALRQRTGSVSFERVPCAVGATVRWLATRRLEGTLDAGLLLGALRAVGHDFSTNDAGTRLEVGARAGIDLALHLGPGRTGLAPVVGVAAEYLPTPYHLAVSGTSREGTVADTPRVWLGFTAGLCWTVQ